MNREEKFTRHYDCVEIVIPREDDAYGGCPLGRENCYECEYLLRGGTLGGEPWIDCSYEQGDTDTNNSGEGD